MGFSLRVNHKKLIRIEPNSADHGAFENTPISVDTKKKELVGAFNAGAKWDPSPNW